MNALAGSRLLIVDDNTDAADSLAMIAEEMGYTVRVAHSGPDALAILEAGFAPAVACLDIGMPQMDGYALAGRIHATWPDIRLIAITGWGSPADVQRAAEAGFDHHFTKPADAALVLQAVEASGNGRTGTLPIRLAHTP